MADLPTPYLHKLKERAAALAVNSDRPTFFNALIQTIDELIQRRSQDPTPKPSQKDVTDAISAFSRSLINREAKVEQEEAQAPDSAQTMQMRQNLETEKLVLRVAEYVVTLVPALRFYGDGGNDGGTTANTVLGAL